VKKIHFGLGCILFFASIPFVAYTQVTDIEGNTYQTVMIGTQLWMAENLKSTKYNDGTGIPLVKNSDWYTLTTPAYCWYNNDYKSFGKIYGALYNGYAVETGKLCPTGWHVPAEDDWIKLSNYLGGEQAAGGKLKKTGTSHWKNPNAGASNSTGFTALPGGARWMIGRFDLLGRRGYWWSIYQHDNDPEAVSRMIGFDEGLFRKVETIKGSGFSVRCVRD
jgi:uncharacterized protein (TIGR02145 family)